MNSDTQVNNVSKLTMHRKTKWITVDSYTVIGGLHYVRCSAHNVGKPGDDKCEGHFDCVAAHKHDTVLLFLVADGASGHWGEMTALANVSDVVFGGEMQQETPAWARAAAKAAVRTYMQWKQPTRNQAA